MLETQRQYFATFQELRRPQAKRLAVLEGNQDCNRSCSYCDVPSHYDIDQELTVDQTLTTVDWIHDQGFRILSYLGGEPFAPFKTKEGKTFTDHTLEIVKHAKQKGMLVNVTTNGDYIPKNQDVVRALEEAGLDSLTFSLHTYTEAGLRRLINGAKMASEHKIIPTIQTVMTSQTADLLPGVAAHAARNGVLFSVGLVQVQGDGFARQQDTSVIPSLEQQKRVFAALRVLKAFGFVRNNSNYLSEAPNYFPNNWTCDAEQDTFIKIGAGGKLNVCSRVETGLRVEDIVTLDDPRWRDNKRAGVSNCGNCLYHCYYEAENPNIIGDVPTIAVALAIKSGRASVVERWGKTAAVLSRKLNPSTNWSLQVE